jgi:hypothetical protein
MVTRRLPWIVAGLTLLVHALANPHYGFFRDELYFIACGRRPDFGYVDQPPVVPLLAAGSQVFGRSLFALRFIPALCAAATVYVGMLLAAELGGGAFAMLTAGVALAFAPVLCAFGEKQGPDMMQVWLWPLVALYVLRVVKGGDPRWWLAAGVATGLAIESKYSVVFFAFALLVALALTPQRAVLRTAWCWAGIGVAAAIALPNFIWQAAHQFPMLELVRNGQLGKNVILSPLQFLKQEVLILNPGLAFVWLAGLGWLLATAGRRWLGYTVLLVLACMIVLHGKDYYPAPVFSLAFAAGGVALERWTARVRLARPALVTFAVATGLALLPFAMPVLPLPRLVAYEQALHLVPYSGERIRLRQVPPDFADMKGWPEMTRFVERAYAALPANERAGAAILTDNYGEASSLQFFGSGLPPVLSGHNQYYLWGPGTYAGGTLLALNADDGELREMFASVTLVGTFSNPLGMTYEDQIPLYACRGLRAPIAVEWPRLKKYI